MTRYEDKLACIIGGYLSSFLPYEKQNNIFNKVKRFFYLTKFNMFMKIYGKNIEQISDDIEAISKKLELLNK